MTIIVRAFLWEDKESVEQFSRQGTYAATEFAKYLRQYYADSGERQGYSTGLPDTLMVAVAENRVVGYLHFYTDYYSYHEKVKIALIVDPAVPAAKEVLERALQEAN